MVGANGKLTCRLDVFLSVTQAEIDGGFGLQIILLCRFRMNAVTFISFDSISGLNTAKIVNCSQIVPVYPKFVSIQLIESLLYSNISI